MNETGEKIVSVFPNSSQIIRGRLHDLGHAFCRELVFKKTTQSVVCVLHWGKKESRESNYPFAICFAVFKMLGREHLHNRLHNELPSFGFSKVSIHISKVVFNTVTYDGAWRVLFQETQPTAIQHPRLTFIWRSF